MSFAMKAAKNNIANTQNAYIEPIAASMEALQMSEGFVTLDKLYKDLDRNSLCLEQLNDLSDEFTTQDAFTQDNVEEYRQNVETILTDAGIDTPVEEVLPAFESFLTDAEYSAEAESRVGNMLKRAGSWLMEQLRKIGEAIMSVLQNLGIIKEKGKARCNRMRRRILALEGKKAEPSTESADGGIHVKDRHLIGPGGWIAISTLRQAQDNAKKAGVETLGMLRKSMDVFKAFKPGQDTSEDGKRALIDKLASALHLQKEGDGYKRELPIGPGNAVKITITEGNGHYRCMVEPTREAADPGTLPGMTSKDCVTMLDVITDGYDKMDTIKKPMDEAARVFKSMSVTMNQGFKDTLATIEGNSDKHNEITAACRAYTTYGLVLSQLGRLPRENISTYMRTTWAMEAYLDACVDALEGKGNKAA